ncbi:4-phosphoerythronate dehydrogenase [Shewanella maritima]|uniref:4-phosphoerythronate dehydrogenase n=1 Tax=Shewanella maritima TaxID=2520507 RepID=UPI0037356504
MKIIADENMPYVNPLFDDFGEVTFVNGRSIDPKQLVDADVLLVRSITQVNEALLADAKQLKFVGSATIGTDHVDQAYLAQRGIHFSNAPGCNATAVGEYAFIAMLELGRKFQQQLQGKVVGIVGAGNTGSAVEKCLRAYGVEVLLCDPLLQAQGDERDFVSLDEIVARADVVSLHVPLTLTGEHRTQFLFDEARLNQLKQGAWLLNCCRGDVVNNYDLIKVMQQRDDIKLVIDVWQNEPQPIDALVPLVDIATPHIAGYSLEGKAKGTYMLYQKLCEIINQAADKQLSELLPRYFVEQFSLPMQTDDKAAKQTQQKPLSKPALASLKQQNQLLTLCRMAYDIRDDDSLFRQIYSRPNGFDNMRKQHKHRREFSALNLLAKQNERVSESQSLSVFTELGFSVIADK